MEIGNEELKPAEKSGNIWVRRLAPNLHLMKAWFLLVYLDGSLRGITVPSWWLHWWAGTPGRQSQVTELYQPGLWLTDTHTGRVNTWCAMILYSIPRAAPWSMESSADQCYMAREGLWTLVYTWISIFSTNLGRLGLYNQNQVFRKSHSQNSKWLRDPLDAVCSF